MQISWGGCSEQALQVNLPCGGIEQVGSAHHVGDALVAIVHNNGELIGEEAVGAQDHKIAAVILHILGLQTLYAIGERDRLVRRSDPPRPRRSSVETAATGPSVALVFSNVLATTSTRIHMAGVAQTLESFEIGIFASALIEHLAVPLESESLQRLKNVSRGAGLHSWRIHIFHADQPLSFVRSRVEIARGCRYQRSEVQRSCRRGRQTVLCNSTKATQKYSIEGLRHTLFT